MTFVPYCCKLGSWNNGHFVVSLHFLSQGMNNISRYLVSYMWLNPAVYLLKHFFVPLFLLHFVQIPGKVPNPSLCDTEGLVSTSKSRMVPITLVICCGLAQSHATRWKQQQQHSLELERSRFTSHTFLGFMTISNHGKSQSVSMHARSEDMLPCQGIVMGVK